MAGREKSPFVRDLLHNLETKQTHLAVFRMWCEEKSPPECQDVLKYVIDNTTQMVDILVQALKRQGERVPNVVPDPELIAEARKQPHSRARLNFAEQFLRRSLAWYEERLERDGDAEERDVWDRLFTLETNNWARVEDYLSP